RDLAVRGVFMDIDDTLTLGGKLDPEAFRALAELQRAGFLVVPVTGRPAGWCDLIARQWPVSGVIGENGAFAFYEHGGTLKQLFHPLVLGSTGADTLADVRARLDQVRDTILERVPGSRVAKDQPYRLFDLAIDFREEAPDLGLEAAERIRAVFEEFGAHAKVSSIHVNGWFGDYDKLSMSALYGTEVLGVDLAPERERFVFVGDSPNDAPMFEFFPHSVGVANVRRFEGRLAAEPTYVTRAEGGAGFAEVAHALLERGVALPN
ncbi:MAG: HAD-IIB family hydrolase, partial [Myxococcota bacterium]